MASMKRFRTRKALAIGIAALAVIGGGGAAIAASGESSSPGRSFFDAVAHHLGISSEKLEDATKAAAIDQVDAALKDGRITQAEADALKQRIESGDFPPFFGPFFGPRFGPDPDRPGPPLFLFGERLSSAAEYLGVTEAELRTKLNGGQTLAQIAKAQGKSVEGLEDAILKATKAKLDELVTEGELTEKEADEMYDRLQSHLDDLVQHGMFRFRFHDGQDGAGAPRFDQPFF
jgi:Arc/MetJ-type ribon-helix-helix transcriptional regulator